MTKKRKPQAAPPEHKRCMGETKRGTRCKAPKANGTDYCAGHLRSIRAKQTADVVTLADKRKELEERPDISDDERDQAIDAMLYRIAMGEETETRLTPSGIRHDNLPPRQSDRVAAAREYRARRPKKGDTPENSFRKAVEDIMGEILGA